MKTRILLFALSLMLPLVLTSARADETITVSATNQDISESLDLRAVATLFGEVDNLEQFEQELNSEKRHLNNLDLNGDGYVDYIRVIEVGEGENRLIVLQAVLAKDIYQDVASIYVEREQDQTVSVQVVGDTYIYGENYIIEPVYLYRPVIYDWFWGPTWVAWHSPYYWGYYSPYYTFYAPWRWDVYYHHIYAFHHHHPRCSYHYAHVPRPGMGTLRGSVHGERIIRNDWANSHPDRSFTARASLRGSSATNARQLQRESRTSSSRPGAMASAGGNARTGASTRGSSAPSAEGTRFSRTPSEARASAAARTFGSANTRESTSAMSTARASRASATTASSQGTTRASASSQSNGSVREATASRGSSSGSNSNMNVRSSRSSATTSPSGTYRSPASSNSSVRSSGSSSNVRSSSGSSMRSSSSSSSMRSSAPSSAGTYSSPASSGSSGVRSSGGGHSSGGGSRSSRR